MLIGLSNVYCSLGFIEMTTTGFIKLCFFYNVLCMTSRTTERRCSRKRITTQLGSESVSVHKESQPAAVMTRWEQQEATTHCGSGFENQIF